MKALLVTLALLALAASAASTYTSGGCPCQTPHLPPPPVTLPYPVHLPPLPPSCGHPPTLPPQPHPCPCRPPVGTTPMVGQCIEFVRHQCSPAATPYCSPQCNALRQQCCQQLRHVDPLHRFQAIFGAVLQQQPHGHPLATIMARQIAQQLIEMCGLPQQPWDVVIHH